MNIVVTGAAGFIGSGVVRCLNDLGVSQLVLVDDLDHPGKVQNLEGRRYKERVGISSLFAWLQGRETEISAVIHLGACSDTLEQNEEYLLNNNTRYTQRLAEYSVKHGIRFIYASSAATYGDGSSGFSDEHEMLPYLKPLNLYGKSKHLFDLWAWKEGLLNQITGLKYFNVFGPNETHKGAMASVIYKMFPILQQEGVIRLFASSDRDRFPDGGQSRDFIYTKDVAHITCSFLQNMRMGIFNIGMGVSTSWNEVAYAMFEAMNLSPRIEYIPMPASLVSQYQNFTRAEMGKFGSAPSGRTHAVRYDIRTAVYDYLNTHLTRCQSW